MYDLLIQNNATKKEWVISGLENVSDNNLYFYFDDFEMPEDAEVFNCMWGSTSEIIIMWVGDKSISAYLKSSWAYYRLCNSTITDYTKERSIALGANSTIISGSYCLSTGTSDDYASFYTSDVIRTKLTLCKIVQA